MAGRSQVATAVAVTVLVLCVTTFHAVRGQPKISNEASVEEGPPTGATPSQAAEDSLENTVFAEMLRIVDQKFDSLSARISVLERSVNSLNFYSVRQFREIAKSVEGSTEATERLRTQIVKLDADDRALKAAVSQVGRDINGIKKNIGVINVGVNDVKSDVDGMMVTSKDFRFNTEKMLDDIATSIVYLNENTKQKSEDLRGYLEARLDSKVDEVSSQLREDRAILLRSVEQLETSSANCSVNLRPLEERLDRKFAEIKRQTHSHFLEILNAEAEEDGGNGNDVEDSAPPSQRSSRHSGNAIEQTPASDQSGGRWDGRGENGGRESGRGREGGRDGEKVMRLLANMTRNVMDAVTYFQHTGGMMERLLATTESVAREQTRLRYEVLEAGGLLPSGLPEDLAAGQHPSSNGSDPHPEDDDPGAMSMGLDNAADVASPRSSDYAKKSSFYRPEDLRRSRAHAVRQPAQEYSSSGQYNPSPEQARPRVPPPNGGGGGLSSEKSLRVLAELTRNGTQLLDVLTDLAQLSSSSLTKAVGSLHQEVVRLEDVRARLNQGLLFPGNKASASASEPGQASGPGLNPSGGGDLAGLTNTTKTIFTIVEAIASNTGWIPYIFHNMQQVERLTNKTLELAKRSLLSVHLNRGLGADSGGSGGGDSSRQPEGSPEGKTSPTRAEALDVIYNTNVQLLRILPALTRLVAEPEPLVALVEGGSSTEGRVEVFFKGRWGSVCADSMGHQEAHALCRHLGHPGGIWAGDGHFGRGHSGRYWPLNVTCLDPPHLLCPFLITDNNGSNVECSAGHFAVICDHMLRLTPVPAELRKDDDDDDNDDNNNNLNASDPHTGILSLHHQGRWLPICSRGWSGYEARVACKQMGYLDGREVDGGGAGEWRQTVANSSVFWVSGVSCTGEESRLDACSVGSFQAETCTDDAPPAAVRCQ